MLKLCPLLLLVVSLFWGCPDEGNVVECDNKRYDPQYEICEDDILKILCGDKGYEFETQFCSENVIFDRCDGQFYRPPHQKCEDNIILSECGEKWYDPSLAYCVSNILKNKETFVDDRDGKVYKYVIIGEQTWMAENLQYETSNTKCYHDNPDYCEIYGILYDWNAANAACPLGWHLPTHVEWNKLIDFASTNGDNAAIRLIANGWLIGNGTDDFGFTALLHGFYRSEDLYTLGVAAFWTVITGSTNWPNHFLLSEYEVKLDGFDVDGSWANVRCIKN
jgi:uncharacterized protein (TIGR02145 family)